MPWMGIWVRPYTVTPVQVKVDFRIIGVGLSQSHIVMSFMVEALNSLGVHPTFMT